MSRRTGKTAYRKDILRTITGSARRFFALALIAVLGTMMYSGLQASCQDLRVSAEEFFDGHVYQRQMQDMRLTLWNKGIHMIKMEFIL